MTRDEFITALRRSLETGAPFRLVSAPGVTGQPVKGFRATLLCVNGEGCSVWLYSRAQVRRMLRLALEAA